jgi:glycosyltransferase involved in cell wall biosynthesis
MNGRILLLAYFFPPIGGAGAQRNTKLAHRLPALGYDLTVVTGPETDGHRWAPLDHELEEEVHERVRVHRLPGPEPMWTSPRSRRKERWLRLTSPWQQWWNEHSVPLALEVGRDADLVYCSLAPFGVAGSAIRIARTLGKPLVFDLEDPWALDEMMAYETGLHRRLELQTMRRTLGAADGIVMNTPESERRLRDAFSELNSIPTTSIVNGYDASDFSEPRPARTNDGILRIVHTGSLHTGAAERRSRVRRLLGGSIEGLHVRSRSLLYLLRSLDDLVAERPELTTRIEVHLAGTLTVADRAAFADSPFVREHGFLPHRATVELIQSADLLFLPMHDVPTGHRIAIVPCKTYEYLGSGRPILAAVPDGDARDFLAASGTARLARPTDVAGMKAAVLDALSRIDSDAIAPSANPSLLRRLERESLTADLIKFIEPLLERQTPAEAVATRRAG